MGWVGILNEHTALLRSAKNRWLYPVYVPSYSRAGSSPLLNMLAQSTLSVKANIFVVVRPSEALAYRRAYPWATVVTERLKGIGPARMRCLLDADVRGFRRIVVLDDDIIHVSLLERVTRPDGSLHTRRFSSKVAGIEEPNLLTISLAVGCKLADGVFKEMPGAAYGAARNALFSGDVDTSIGATLNKGSFPACVMFFDVKRFTMRDMPKPYAYHGEDLAMFLDTLTQDQQVFTLPGVAYDQHGSIASTIPLDPQDDVGRPHLAFTSHDYPDIHPYLRVSMRNKVGGVMRIGVKWPQWYKDTDSSPINISLDTILP